MNTSAVVYGSISTTLRLLELPQPFGSGLFAGMAVEAARTREPLGDPRAVLTRYGMALCMGAATALGSANAGIGIGQDGSCAFYLPLGRP